MTSPKAACSDSFLSYVRPMTRVALLTRFLAWSLVLFASAVSIAWGHEPAPVGTKTKPVALATPSGLVSRVADRSVILHWEPVTAAGLAGYQVSRASSEAGPAEHHGVTVLDNHFVDFEVENNATYHYQVRTVDTAGRESPAAALHATPRVLDDAAFLDLVQHTAFDYFWYETNPHNGLVRDRSGAALSSIAAVGFGLSALTVLVPHAAASPNHTRTQPADCPGRRSVR